MSHDAEIHQFLLDHLEAIRRNDIDHYHATTSPELTLYEWWVTPHRIDGIPFHDFMMGANAERGAVFGAENSGPLPANADFRFDLSNLHIQRYGDTAIASYTLLISTRSESGVSVASHNESRVIVKIDGQWQIVHVHKSPAWSTPHIAPNPN